MKRILSAIIAAIIGYTISCWSQSYYEASGQSPIFNIIGIPKSIVKQQTIATQELISRKAAITQSKNKMISVTLPLSIQSANVTIINIQGKRVFHLAHTTDRALSIDTRRFSPGIYTVVVFDGTQTAVRCIPIFGTEGR